MVLLLTTKHSNITWFENQVLCPLPSEFWISRHPPFFFATMTAKIYPIHRKAVSSHNNITQELYLYKMSLHYRTLSIVCAESDDALCIGQGLIEWWILKILTIIDFVLLQFAPAEWDKGLCEGLRHFVHGQNCISVSSGLWPYLSWVYFCDASVVLLFLVCPALSWLTVIKWQSWGAVEEASVICVIEA